MLISMGKHPDICKITRPTISFYFGPMAKGKKQNKVEIFQDFMTQAYASLSI